MAWRNGFAVSSNYARENAELVAMAASLSLITTRITEGVYGREWNVTVKGLRWYNEQTGVELDDEHS